jgi:DNA-directed RNA polymerase subunit RPC12/RpoP
MNIKINQEEFDKVKYREKVLCNCEFCKKDFLKTKSDLLKKIKKGDETLFCSTKCFNLFFYKNNGFSDARKQKIREKIILKNKERLELNGLKYDYKCSDCGSDYKINHKLRKDRKAKCDKCKKKRVIYDKKDISSLYDLSLRTVQKILKRAKIKCGICKWDKTTLDIHHINGRKIKNANAHKNLVCLCPNCHRLAHEKKIKKEELNKINLDIVFKNWKDYYNTK